MNTPVPPASSPIEIKVEGLDKSFGSNHVLRGIDLTVHRGEMVAIVGGSGCGKTVLMQHLIGHMHPDKGRVLLADQESEGSPLVDLSTLDEDGMDLLRTHWAVVFQRNALISGTVEENVALPLQLVNRASSGCMKDSSSSTARIPNSQSPRRRSSGLILS